MFDDLITKIFETHKRVLDETNLFVSLRISRICVETLLFEGDHLINSNSAFFYSDRDMQNNTRDALENILAGLERMLKSGTIEM